MKKREMKNELTEKKECPCKKGAKIGGFIACVAILTTLFAMYKRNAK